MRIRHLPRQHNSLVRARHALDARQLPDLGQERGARELDGLADDGFVRDVVLDGHDAADHLGGSGDEARDEDVVVDAVADAAADDADGEGEGCDGGDEVVGADDGRCGAFDVRRCEGMEGWE